MRTFAVLFLVFIGIPCANDTLRAEQPDNCKQCRDQQRACLSNYAGKTCKFEYDICMKGCRKK